MKARIKGHKVILITSFTLTLYFLFGCDSTQEIEEEPECRSPSNEICEPDEGQERGYDPCLVNKNLPVCKD
jgi:hypothetical protein